MLTLGFDWHPLRLPIVLDPWSDRRSVGGGPECSSSFTTIASWIAYGGCEYNGEIYGQRDVEFVCFIILPQRTSHCVESTVSGDNVPADALRANGWRLVDQLAISGHLWRYQDDLRSSRGECGEERLRKEPLWVAQRPRSELCGVWTATVVRDTGVADDVRIGKGLLLFVTVEAASKALDTVVVDYETHRQVALEIARMYFDASKVLMRLLNVSGA